LDGRGRIKLGLTKRLIERPVQLVKQNRRSPFGRSTRERLLGFDLNRGESAHSVEFTPIDARCAALRDFGSERFDHRDAAVAMNEPKRSTICFFQMKDDVVDRSRAEPSVMRPAQGQRPARRRGEE
jgi:hypothetical protein